MEGHERAEFVLPDDKISYKSPETTVISEQETLTSHGAG